MFNTKLFYLFLNLSIACSSLAMENNKPVLYNSDNNDHSDKLKIKYQHQRMRVVVYRSNGNDDAGILKINRQAQCMSCGIKFWIDKHHICVKESK